MSEANRRTEITVKDDDGNIQLRFQMLDDWTMTVGILKPSEVEKP